MTVRLGWTWSCVAVLLCAAPLQAQERRWDQAGPSDRLSVDLPLDLAVGGFAALGAGATELFADHLVPAGCRLCDGQPSSGLAVDPRSGRGALNGFDAAAHDALTGFAFGRSGDGTASSVLAYLLIPAGSLASASLAVGPDASNWAGLRASGIVLESAAVAALVTGIVKVSAARQRPFVRYGNGGSPGSGDDPAAADARMSLPSGHTAISAAFAFACAETATLQGSRAAPFLWTGAAASSAAVGLLRIGAEKHYATDVLLGLAIGAGSGVAIPWLHRRGSWLSGSSVMAAPRGVSLAVRF